MTSVANKDTNRRLSKRVEARAIILPKMLVSNRLDWYRSLHRTYLLSSLPTNSEVGKKNIGFIVLEGGRSALQQSRPACS